MCSSSSTGSDSDAKVSEQLSAININEKASVDYFGSVLPTEILVKIFDFLDNDHDSLEALHFTSKRMVIRIKPFLMAERKKLLDAFVDFLNLNTIEKEGAFLDEIGDSRVSFLDNCALFLHESEKYLKRVLRTNEYLSLSAHNLPVAQLSNVMIGVGGSVCDEAWAECTKCAPMAVWAILTPQNPCTYAFVGKDDDDLMPVIIMKTFTDMNLPFKNQGVC
ncbi:hypothetical protein GPALN_005733 [Globodera pallida]|nr:hypothetical protein GPALN_005733 [Globodera pallida]